MVGLRHCGTHEQLPSLSALRTGAEFALSWLKVNYWEPQNLTIGEHYDTSLSQPVRASGAGRKGGAGDSGEGIVWRLTKGLCRTRFELFDLLNTGSVRCVV